MNVDRPHVHTGPGTFVAFVLMIRELSSLIAFLDVYEVRSLRRQGEVKMALGRCRSGNDCNCFGCPLTVE